MCGPANSEHRGVAIGEPPFRGHSAHRLTEWALLRLDPFDRLVDRREHLVVELGPQPCQALALPHRFKLRPFTRRQPDLLPESMRNHENVGKQNCRIEPKSADRLQRCFGRKLWVEPKLEKSPAFFRYSGR